MGSVKSRKVSTQSLQSTTSTDEMPSSSYAIFEEASAGEVGGGTAGAAASNVGEDYQDFRTDFTADVGDETDYSRHMPWIKVRFLHFLHIIAVLQVRSVVETKLIGTYADH
jgi:hypothetical protein